MNIIETDRLYLRVPLLSDARIIMSLFNQEDCIKFIGDKNIKSIADTEAYIEKNFLNMYKEHGFCLFVIEQKSNSAITGLCGLIKREGLDDVDLGFAVLTDYQKKGIVTEAALAVKDYAFNTLKLKRLLGITSINNHASIAVLEKVGLRFEKLIKLKDDSTSIKLFSLDV